MQNINYQKVLEQTIENLQKEGAVKSLLLHSCCAPCSSYVLEYLSQFFSITVFYYNPNISPEEELNKRIAEQKRLIAELPVKHPIQFLEGIYDPQRFLELVKGLEDEKEGGRRCEICYRMRLEETAKLAAKEHMDYFTTTLSISPLKRADKLNAIGGELAKEYKVPYLFSDFKKKGGYQRSVELSKEYALYRQNYCGCIFSKREAILRERDLHE